MTQAHRNPYRPGVGLQPTYLAGRDGDIETFRSVLAGSPEIPANARLTGLRGVGKTVLLRELQRVAEDEGWATISVELEPRHCSTDALEAMIRNKSEETKRSLSLMQRVRQTANSVGGAARRAATVSFEGFTWSLSGDLDAKTAEVAEHLLDVVKVATQKGKLGLALFFDEAQILTDSKSETGDHALSTLIAGVSTLQKQGVPISLSMCGLPTLSVNLLRARTYSERMFRGFQIDSLPERAAKDALTVPLDGTAFEADDSLVSRVVNDVDGYPYFIQLWGAELWDTAYRSGVFRIANEMLDLIEGKIQARLDLDFYSPRIDSLTPAEQDVLLASATCTYPPLRVSEMNSASPKSPENINVLLGRLVLANVLYRPRKGEYLYTAPKFRDFLLRRSEQDSSY